MAVAFMVSCQRDKLDFDQIEDLALNPELEVPLVNFKMTLGDLVNQDTNFTTQPNGSVKVKYFIDSLFSFPSEEFVELGALPPDSVPIVAASSPVAIPNQTVKLDVNQGTELYQAEMKSGAFNLGLNSSAPYNEDIELKMTIVNSRLNGSPLSQNIVLPRGSTSSLESLDLSGAIIDFTNGGMSSNVLELSIEQVQTANGNLTDSLIFSFAGENLKIESTTAFFGQRVIPLAEDKFAFDDASFGELSEGLLLADPRLVFVVKNSIVAPLKLDINLEGENNNGQTLALQSAPQTIEPARSISEQDSTGVEYNTQNSNIAEFINHRPTQLRYSGQVELNPNGQTTNEIGDESRLDVAMLIEAPLRLSIDDLKLVEEIEGIDFLSASPAEIEELEFIFYLKNDFPFDLNIKAALLDSATGDSINGFELGVLDAAPVGPNGRVIQTLSTTKNLILPPDVIADLDKTEKLRVRAKLNTQNSGSAVELLSTYQLDLRLAVKTKLNIPISEL